MLVKRYGSIQANSKWPLIVLYLDVSAAARHTIKLAKDSISNSRLCLMQSNLANRNDISKGWDGFLHCECTFLASLKGMRSF